MSPWFIVIAEKQINDVHELYPIHDCRRKTLENSHLKCALNTNPKRKIEELTKFTSTFGVAGLNGICGMCWMMVVVAATVVRLVQNAIKMLFEDICNNAFEKDWELCVSSSSTQIQWPATTCTGKSKFSVRWIRDVHICNHARCCACRKDTLVSFSFTGITSYLPLKVKDKLLTLSVSVKTFIYLFEPKTCRRSRSHIRSRCRLVALHTHIRFCPISIFIPFDVICYSIHLHAKSV